MMVTVVMVMSKVVIIVNWYWYRNWHWHWYRNSLWPRSDDDASSSAFFVTGGTGDTCDARGDDGHENYNGH